MRGVWRWAVVLVLAVDASAQEPKPAPEPVPGFTIVSPKGDGIEAVDLNDRGDVIGFEWVEEPAGSGVVLQKPFLARGEAVTYLPILEGYTFTFPAAVSDEGLVVGRVSKPAPPGVFVPLRTQAFVWGAESGIRGLGTLEGDHASLACGISGDGRRISGWSIGNNRKRACYWDRDGDGWKVFPLPQTTSMLGTDAVAISEDGRFIASVDGLQCCLWSRDPSGVWFREEIADTETLLPRAVNNEGTIVGVRFPPDGNPRAVVWTRGQGVQMLDLPPGYERSEATDVNNAGVVVGLIDGPRGSNLGPNGFAYERGKLHILTQGDLPFTGATAINDRRQVTGFLEQEEAVDEPDAPETQPRN